MNEKQIDYELKVAELKAGIVLLKVKMLVDKNVDIDKTKAWEHKTGKNKQKLLVQSVDRVITYRKKGWKIKWKIHLKTNQQK